MVIAAASLGILYSLYILVSGKTITIDQGNQALDIRSFCLGLCYRSKKVSFSKVEAINIEHHEGGGGGQHEAPKPDFWNVYLVFEKFKKVKVCSNESEQKQTELARILSETLGKDVRRMDAPPDFFTRIFSGNEDNGRPPNPWNHL